VTATKAPPEPPPAQNKAPTITLVLAQGNGTFSAPASIALRATVSDSDGKIRQVRFYSGSTLIGSDTNGPSFSLTWRNVSAGKYSITAAATDDAGATTRSAVLEVAVYNSR
jgi:chitinase